MTVDFTIVPGPAVKDEAPPAEGQDFNPDYPGSTPDAPYGFKPDGTPYRRKPKGSGGSATVAGTGVTRTAATLKQAEVAAGMLGQLNSIFVLALNTAGLIDTGNAVAKANDQFVQQATMALVNDPALCRKITSTGASSGKAGLAIAYGMLAVNIAPVARAEFSERRDEVRARREAQDD